MYGNKEAQIEYLPFLKDTFVLKYVINEPYTGKHSTYEEKNTDFSGAREMQELMQTLENDNLFDILNILERWHRRMME